MRYRYETHCHCASCSACSRATPRELVRAYHQAGFAGLVLTDHFVSGNTAVDRSLPWEEQMKRYYQAYLDAKELGDALDFDVIFGIEHAYGHGKEVLLYGVELDFLLDNPDLLELSLEELVDRVHACGGIAVHAHPYRDRFYIDMTVPPRADWMDGIEVHNAGNQPGEDRQALALARQGDYILTCGGDIHSVGSPWLGTAGIAFPYRVKNSREFARALKAREHQFLVGGRLLQEIREEDLP